MQTFNENGLNLDLFSVESEIKTVRKGRPDVLHENLDFAETRLIKFSQDDSKVFFSRRKTNIEEKAKELDRLEGNSVEDIEEQSAFKSISLVHKYWKKLK